MEHANHSVEPVYFYQPKNPNGYLSNWYPSKFIAHELADGTLEFANIEQYMMYRKALILGDEETMAKVLTTDDPKELKTIGQNMKNFDLEKWKAERMHIVFEGLYWKFNQNPKLLKKLLATGDAIIAEASPWDKNWGIGLNTYAARGTKSVSEWKGKNMLGECLMQARESFRKKALESEHEGVVVEME